MSAILAPAKVNLALHVTSKRDDGYHNLSSIVAFADIADHIEIEPSEKNLVNFTGEFADGLDPKSNSVLDALTFLQAQFGLCENFSILVTKNIPVQAGLGGGSADAAAVIRWAVESFDLIAPSALDLATLGADVPVCFANRPALMEGIGEIVAPIELEKNYAIILVNPRKTLSTGKVFSALAQYSKLVRPKKSYSIQELILLENSLELPAIQRVPEIDWIISALQAENALLARMSGSGASVFGLFDTNRAAQIATSRLQRRFPEFWIKSAQLIRSTT